MLGKNSRHESHLYAAPYLAIPVLVFLDLWTLFIDRLSLQQYISASMDPTYTGTGARSSGVRMVVAVAVHDLQLWRALWDQVAS